MSNLQNQERDQVGQRWLLSDNFPVMFNALEGRHLKKRKFIQHVNWYYDPGDPISTANNLMISIN